MRLLAAFFRRHPSLFGDTHPGAEPPQCSGAEEWSWQPAASPSIARSCRHGYPLWGEGCPQLQGVRAQPKHGWLSNRAPKSSQLTLASFPAEYTHPSLFWFGLCGEGSLYHPLIQLLSENRSPGGGLRGVPVFDLSICRCYGHGRHFSKPDQGVSVRIWFQQPAASKEES